MNLKSIFQLVTFSIAILMTDQNAFAWGDYGHAAVGEIAERNLSPAAKSMVRGILGIDALANAAVWPDQARSDKRYDAFANYHFFEIPEGFTIETLPHEIRAKRSANVLLQAIPKALAKVGNRDEEMIMLRYLVHLVGDVHQPLHLGNGKDRGANLCDVLWVDPFADENVKPKKENLHSVMDDHLFAYFKKKTPAGRYFNYGVLTDMVLVSAAGKAVNKESVEKATLEEWYEQSRQLRDGLYPDQLPGTKAEDRTYCRIVDPGNPSNVITGKYNRESLPTLGEEWAKRVLPIVQAQLVKAGYRLAFLLNQLADQRGDRGHLNSEYEKNILDRVQFELE